MIEFRLMKVLLISPKDPDQPGRLEHLTGGENTFTQSLLNNPPLGVEYLHYQQGLKEGKITYGKWQKFFSLLMHLRLLPPDAGILDLEIKEKFDLIHSHAYCLRLKNYSGPVILSDSSSNYLFLKDYLGWSGARIDFTYKVRKFVDQIFKVYDSNLNLYRTKKLIVWSDFAKKIHQKLGVDPKKIIVIPPGIKRLPVKKKKTKSFTILFVGVWFERKGGKLLLKTYQILKKKYPSLKLILIGKLPKDIQLPKNVQQYNYLPREELVGEIFPRADVLVLTPPKAEGYGLVVLEAASLGIPAIVTKVYALPEIVDDQKIGFVIQPGDLKALVDRLEKLITNHDLTNNLGQAALKKFNAEFLIEKTNRRLFQVYQEAVRINH